MALRTSRDAPGFYDSLSSPPADGPPDITSHARGLGFGSRSPPTSGGLEDTRLSLIWMSSCLPQSQPSRVMD